MTIEQIVRDGEGKAHNWRVKRAKYPDESVELCYLWHHSTCMLIWNPITKVILDYNTGWGSKSDQDGMNIAFRVLGSELYYSRRNGASIG